MRCVLCLLRDVRNICARLARGLKLDPLFPLAGPLVFKLQGDVAGGSGADCGIAADQPTELCEVISNTGQASRWSGGLRRASPSVREPESGRHCCFHTQWNERLLLLRST